jgi:exosortase family protein XrtF
MSIFKEFKSIFVFISVFVGVYIISNLLYGLYIESFSPQPDPITRLVSRQVKPLLSAFGYDVSLHDYKQHAATAVVDSGVPVIEIYEGCNGVNTAIVFLAFILSFGYYNRSMAYIIVFGLLAIHLTNIFRVASLFIVAKEFPENLYFFHKYLFTGILYLVVFMVWIFWIRNIKAVQK